MTEKRVRHILSLSGGKDSAALAVYMRDKIPEMEYVFCDTRKELPETYDFLARLEAHLGKSIVRLSSDRGFDHWLLLKGNYLPSSRMRWCTEYLKIKPFEKYVGSDEVRLYVGIRADEDRTAYVSSKPNIKSVFPFVQDGIDIDGVYRILNESGVALPAYYSWRSRSGCFFCFFQRRAEWVGLLEHHPDLFEQAKAYEKVMAFTGERYTWTQRESLEELSRPERVQQIKRASIGAIERKIARARTKMSLYEVFSEVLEDENDEEPCFFCQT